MAYFQFASETIWKVDICKCLAVQFILSCTLLFSKFDSYMIYLWFAPLSAGTMCECRCNASLSSHNKPSNLHEYVSKYLPGIGLLSIRGPTTIRENQCSSGEHWRGWFLLTFTVHKCCVLAWKEKWISNPSTNAEKRVVNHQVDRWKLGRVQNGKNDLILRKVLLCIYKERVMIFTPQRKKRQGIAWKNMRLIFVDCEITELGTGVRKGHKGN